MLGKLPKLKSEQEVNAFARLASAPEFEAFRRYLADALASKDVENRTCEGPDLYRNQGMALVLAEVLDLMDKAREGPGGRSSRAVRSW